jgi:hypothetical protein
MDSPVLAPLVFPALTYPPVLLLLAGLSSNPYRHINRSKLRWFTPFNVAPGSGPQEFLHSPPTVHVKKQSFQLLPASWWPGANRR